MPLRDAGAFLISPFVGRILDWHVKNGGKTYTAETDPGVLSVRSIYAYYKAYGDQNRRHGRLVPQHRRDRGAGRLRSPDRSPRPARQLGKDRGDSSAGSIRRHAARARKMSLDEKSFRLMLNEDAMATEKLAEGIRLFAHDLNALRAMVEQRLAAAA